MSAGGRRAADKSFGLLIRMSEDQRELVHELARASGTTARLYVLGLVSQDLARRRRREIAKNAALHHGEGVVGQ